MDQNKKGVRIIVASIVLAFVLYVMIRIFLDESISFSPAFANSPTMFFVVWAIIVLFSLTFLFILIRNIIKLIFEKDKTYTGGRFKNRLVFFFIAFSIIPSLLLFFFATVLINRGIDKWFEFDIDNIMNKFSDLNSSYYEKARDELKHFSSILAEDIKSKKKYTRENRFYLQNSLKPKLKEYKIDVINIYRNQKEILSLINAIIPLQEYKDLPLDIVYRGLGDGDTTRIDPLKNGELIRTGVRFNTVDNESILVIIGKYFPPNYIRNLKTLSSMVRKYSQMKKIKDPVKNTFILLFIFITIMIIFSASWIGMYLARGITVPINKVSAAVSEIAQGNLDIKIDYTAKDEFNVLIREFNKMVTDLKDNREKLNLRTNELKQRRSMTENILINITSGVIALNSHGEIMEMNPAAEKMLALNSENVLKKKYATIFSGTLYKDLNQLIKKSFETKFKLIEDEVDMKVKGKIMNLAIKITQIRNVDNKKMAGILVVFTDLTELIKAQRMLVWREVAKRIAHEIKNPLTPITISSQRILKALELDDKKLRKIVEDSLNIILQELDSIKSLAEEFGNFARLPEIKFTKGDINQIIEKLVSVYTSIYNNVEFKVNLDIEIPILVKMDQDQMKRIFVNIIDNAIGAMNETGTIEITSSYNKETQFLRIEIADDGEGISDEDKQKLFIPYFSKKGAGTGLGLAISHNIIEEHNGQISVVDNQPKGVRFIIEIPA